MHVPAIQGTDAASFADLKRACQILILNENFPAYSRAVEVCRRLMDRGDRLDFEIKCWSFLELADSGCARRAARAASLADLVLLSIATVPLPGHLDEWLDFSFTGRGRPAGLLALVINALEAPAQALEAARFRLEQVAGRLGMNFVSLLPGDDAMALPLSPAAPPRTGINA